MRNDAISVLCRKMGIPREDFHQNYEILGKAMIFREDDAFLNEYDRFGKLMLSSFRLWSIYGYRGIRDETRIPSIRLISGIHTAVTQKENGIYYSLDPEKTMFSKGNKKERHRLLDIVGSDETVLDMFAGIGYFSIPISFKAKKVYSCEINPESFHYLLVNKMKNAANRLIPMLGDSSKLPMTDFADRIIMGHFESHRYLWNALTYLKTRGVIHLHLLAERGGYGKIVEKYERYEFVREVTIRKVKSYSPSRDHVALDIEVIKH